MKNILAFIIISTLGLGSVAAQKEEGKEKEKGKKVGSGLNGKLKKTMKNVNKAVNLPEGENENPGGGSRLTVTEEGVEEGSKTKEKKK